MTRQVTLRPPTVLRLRSDTYYIPIPGGVWIRTTDNSFTLRGRTVAAWVERLAPMLDRGLAVEEVLASLSEEQARYVATLLEALEGHHVVRRELVSAAPPDALEQVYQQQFEFLRHFVADPVLTFAAVRHCPVAVAGQEESATHLAAGLFAAGFADVTLADVQPSAELRAVVGSYAGLGVQVELHGPGDLSRIKHVIGVFEDAERALAWSDRLMAAGTGCWFGVSSGQAILLRAGLAGSNQACLRCAWRRLVHPAVGVSGPASLGPVHLAMAAAVLTQDLFRHVSGALRDGAASTAEGVVVDLTRLSIWRTPIAPDPTCPAAQVHGLGQGRDNRAPRSAGDFAKRQFRARCFGPVISCSAEELLQVPLAALQLRLNRIGRSEPVAEVGGPVVVAEVSEAARHEAALIGVESELAAVHGDNVGAGVTLPEALTRAVCRWAARTGLDGWSEAGEPDGVRDAVAFLTSLPLGAPAVRLACHPSGLWSAQVDDTPVCVDLSPASAAQAALLTWVALRRQFPWHAAADIVAAVDRPAVRELGLDQVAACLAELKLEWSAVPAPALVSGDVVAVVLRSEPRGLA